MITNAGLSIITAAIKAAAAEPKYLGWGIGTTESAAADTTLTTASAEARTAGTTVQTNTGGTTNDTYQVTGTITCTAAAKAITEVGLFTASTAGNMLMHANFSAINVEVGDSIEFVIQNTFDQA